MKFRYLNRQHNKGIPSGFALVATVSMMVLMTLIAVGMLSLSTIEQRSSGGGANEADRTARSNARMALMIALGELQKAAGPDQRVTATASILGSADNPYATGTPAQDGKKHWMGVWSTDNYSPANPDAKTFQRWLVSGEQDQLDALGDARTPSTNDHIAIFAGVDDASTVKVPKVEVATAAAGDSSYYAYWVEDQGVKADLAWNEGNFSDVDRQQSARLSTSPGPDHAVFEGPFSSGVAYPLEKGSGYVDELQKAFSPSDMPLVTGNNTSDYATWLKTNRHDMALNVRGVMANVKKGGLRRDLSLAFEMDGNAESENATIFNQQTTEFVGNGDKLSSPYNMPGVFLNNDPTKPLKARELFRDYNNCWYIPNYTSAGTPFSADITTTNAVVRGPSWWLLRDYANLYKRLESAGSTRSLSARAYYPNRTTPGITQDLGDIHSDNQENYGYTKIRPNNQEFGTYDGNDLYAYRPLRASYAPVVLGVNNILSLVYSNNKLQLVVDPFFIIWNPYNTQITAKKFAVTIENGFGGGIRFRVTDANDNVTLHGQPGWIGRGSQTTFVDYARNKAGDIGMDLSYLITDLSMDPGEVMFYSPTNDKDRNNDDPANTLHDDLTPGLNYNATDSGIFFDKFPNDTVPQPQWWKPKVIWDTIPGSDEVTPEPVIDSDSKIEVLFNIYYRNRSGIANVVETNIPNPNRVANEMIDEASYGDQVASHEFRLNARANPWDTENNFNINHGTGGFSYSFTFDELSTTKTSFAILSMLNTPTDFSGSDTSLEVFSQLNVTPTVRSRKERGGCTPLNITVNAVTAVDIDNLLGIVGIDLDAFNDGNNAFYGKDYSSIEGDTSFPLIDIPNAPMHSLVQLSGANMGIRLVEPTHAIGNSWRPPYIPEDSIYYNRMNFNDVSWQANDALFDQYYFSGIAPTFDYGGGTTGTSYRNTGTLKATLDDFYGETGTSYKDAEANPALEPHVPAGKLPAEIVTELSPTNANQDGYKKMGAYSLIKGAFNVNSTSVKAWRAFLQGNKALALESAQGTTESGTGTAFPLASTTSNTSSNNAWEKFSRLTDDQIWDDHDTPSDLTDDTGLAVEIVNQVKARGPFMSLSDFVNRRIGNDNRSDQGAIQEAIEQAEINGTYDPNTDTYDGIRGSTSDSKPNYSILVDGNRERMTFPFTDESYVGNRNNATGIPLEINQANILLPLAPRLSARSDTFKIRAYGEVRDSNDNIIAQATCEAIVQRLPEYVDPNTNAANNEPWDDDSQAPTLNTLNQTYGRRFEIQSFRWLDQSEV